MSSTFRFVSFFNRIHQEIRRYVIKNTTKSVITAFKVTRCSSLYRERSNIKSRSKIGSFPFERLDV